MDELNELALSFLKGFSPEQLSLAIKENVSLKELMETYASFLAMISKAMAKANSSQVNYFTPENVLEWLKFERPDLYRIIQSDLTSRQWFNQQVNELKVFWFG